MEPDDQNGSKTVKRIYKHRMRQCAIPLNYPRFFRWNPKDLPPFAVRQQHRSTTSTSGTPRIDQICPLVHLTKRDASRSKVQLIEELNQRVADLGLIKIDNVLEKYQTPDYEFACYEFDVFRTLQFNDLEKTTIADHFQRFKEHHKVSWKAGRMGNILAALLNKYILGQLTRKQDLIDCIAKQGVECTINKTKFKVYTASHFMALMRYSKPKKKPNDDDDPADKLKYPVGSTGCSHDEFTAGLQAAFQHWYRQRLIDSGDWERATGQEGGVIIPKKELQKKYEEELPGYGGCFLCIGDLNKLEGGNNHCLCDLTRFPDFGASPKDKTKLSKQKKDKKNLVDIASAIGSPSILVLDIMSHNAPQPDHKKKKQRKKDKKFQMGFWGYGLWSSIMMHCMLQFDCLEGENVTEDMLIKLLQCPVTACIHSRGDIFPSLSFADEHCYSMALARGTAYSCKGDFNAANQSIKGVADDWFIRNEYDYHRRLQKEDRYSKKKLFVQMFDWFESEEDIPIGRRNDRMIICSDSVKCGSKQITEATALMLQMKGIPDQWKSLFDRVCNDNDWEPQELPLYSEHGAEVIQALRTGCSLKQRSTSTPIKKKPKSLSVSDPHHGAPIAKYSHPPTASDVFYRIKNSVESIFGNNAEHIELWNNVLKPILEKVREQKDRRFRASQMMCILTNHALQNNEVDDQLLFNPPRATPIGATTQEVENLLALHQKCIPKQFHFDDEDEVVQLTLSTMASMIGYFQEDYGKIGKVRHYALFMECNSRRVFPFRLDYNCNPDAVRIFNQWLHCMSWESILMEMCNAEDQFKITKVNMAALSAVNGVKIMLRPQAMCVDNSMTPNSFLFRWPTRPMPICDPAALAIMAFGNHCSIHPYIESERQPLQGVKGKLNWYWEGAFFDSNLRGSQVMWDLHDMSDYHRIRRKHLLKMEESGDPEHTTQMQGVHTMLRHWARQLTELPRLVKEVHLLRYKFSRDATSLSEIEMRNPDMSWKAIDRRSNFSGCLGLSLTPDTLHRHAHGALKKMIDEQVMPMNERELAALYGANSLPMRSDSESRMRSTAQQLCWSKNGWKWAEEAIKERKWLLFGQIPLINLALHALTWGPNALVSEALLLLSLHPSHCILTLQDLITALIKPKSSTKSAGCTRNTVWRVCMFSLLYYHHSKDQVLSMLFEEVMLFTRTAISSLWKYVKRCIVDEVLFEDWTVEKATASLANIGVQAVIVEIDNLLYAREQENTLHSESVSDAPSATDSSSSSSVSDGDTRYSLLDDPHCTPATHSHTPKKGRKSPKGSKKSSSRKVQQVVQPNPSQDELWSDHDRDLFRKGFHMYGRDWKRIATMDFLNQSEKSIMKYAAGYLIKLFLEQKQLPPNALKSGRGYTVSGKPLKQVMSAQEYAYF